MTADERNDKLSYWGAMILIAIMVVPTFWRLFSPERADGNTFLRLNLLPAIFVACCFIYIFAVITRQHQQVVDLRRQLARVDAHALPPAGTPKDGSPKDGSAKGAYSEDDDGQRRLHISRLQ